MDEVDLAAAQWRSQRPELDISPFEVFGRVQRLAVLVNTAIQKFARANGLEQSELDVLMTLRRADADLSAGDLLASSMVTSGAITGRIDRLEGKNLVERLRSGDDRRVVRVRLTTSGVQLVDRLIGEHLHNEDRLLAGLDQDQRRNVIEMLRLLLQSVREAEAL
ncbi:MarR family winged helix-turn-helix transcriptional regulator [Microbacterium sp. NPDC090007]|uniref:MarR family winged helix-turn-helix transcriptional regulator n=1 Tax=Microbacterium sp. NPDC090007 TaxID=3364204 RepID=UPI0037FCA176